MMGYWFQVPLHFLRSWPVSWGLQPHSDDLCSRSGLHVWSHGPQEVWWGVLGERNGWHRFRWLRTMADISTKPRKKVHLANMVVILKNSSPWGIPWNCEFQQHGGCAQSPFSWGEHDPKVPNPWRLDIQWKTTMRKSTTWRYFMTIATYILQTRHLS